MGEPCPERTTETDSCAGLGPGVGAAAGLASSVLRVRASLQGSPTRKKLPAPCRAGTGASADPGPEQGQLMPPSPGAAPGSPVAGPGSREQLIPNASASGHSTVFPRHPGHHALQRAAKEPGKGPPSLKEAPGDMRVPCPREG